MAVCPDTDLKKKLTRSQQSCCSYRDHKMTYLGSVLKRRRGAAAHGSSYTVLLWIGQRDPQARSKNECRLTRGGRILALREVWSNTDAGVCSVSERSGHHHGGALGCRRCASLPSARPTDCAAWLDVNSSLTSCLGPAWLLLLSCHRWPAEERKDKIRKTQDFCFLLKLLF